MKLNTKNCMMCIVISLIAIGCMKDEVAEGIRIDILDQVKSTDSNMQINIPKEVNKVTYNEVTKVTGQAYNYIFRDQPELAWNLDLEIGKILNALLIQGSRIIVLGDQGKLICLDLISKKVLWSHSLIPFDSENLLVGGGLSADQSGNLYVTSSIGELLSISVMHGTVNWNYRIDAPVMDAPTVVGDNVFVVDANNVLRSVSSKGILNWSLKGISNHQIRTKTGKPTPAGALILFPTSSGLLTAVNRLSGEKQWDFKFNWFRPGYTDIAFGAFNGDPIVSDKIIYFGSVTGQFNALKLNGEVLWQARFGLQGSPILVSNSLFLVTDTNNLVRVNKLDGSLIWSKKLGNNSNMYFRPILLDSHVWIVSSDGNLSSYDVLTGDLVDQVSINFKIGSHPIYHNGTVILSTDSGKLIGLN